MLVLVSPRTAISSFNLRRLTPVLPIAIGRPSPSPHRPLPKEPVNARRLQTAAAEIPIASDAPPRHTSRGFLPWRFADAGPRVRRATIMGPASENLHMSGPTPHRSTLADAFANLTESCSYQNRSPRFAPVSMLNLLYRKSPVISLPTQSGNSSTRSSRSNSTSAITTPFRMPS